VKENLEIAKIHETITDMIEDHIMVCDETGRIIFANKAMRAYVGCRDFDLKQKSFFELVSNTHAAKARSFFVSAQKEPSGWEEFSLGGKSGTPNLHLKIFKKDGLIYIYGNEKYAKYEKIIKKMDAEIASAIKIHRRSLPEHLPDSEHILFSSLYIPAEDLGGDLFDAFKVDNGLLSDSFEQYVCFIADVSGHGLDSAMLAIFVKDTIRSFFRLKHIAGQVLSPAEIMNFFIEQYVKEGYPEEYLVCLFLVVFDLKTNELTYCNAGLHISPLLIEGPGRITQLCNTGLPASTAIGADLLKYKDTSLPLSAGATLFLMSDGLPEQRSNGTFYEKRLKELFAKSYPLPPFRIIQNVREDFADFLGNEKIRDDITLLVVKLL
jgi:sigma-B regulation protein RsbU (phosphoserine phosphatase)